MAKVGKILISGMGLVVKRITLLGLSVLFASYAAFADNSNNWISIAPSDTTEYSAKKGTFKDAKGESSTLMMFDNRGGKAVKYYKVSIKNTDCDNGFGKLSFSGMNGKLDFQGDYVADGDSVDVGTGDFTCAVRAATVNA